MEEVNGFYKIAIPWPDNIKGCAVCYYAHIPVDAFNQIHDCYYDTYGKVPSENNMPKMYVQLRKNDNIRNLATRWGWDDTEVREAIYKWMKHQIIILKNRNKEWYYE